MVYKIEFTTAAERDATLSEQETIGSRMICEHTNIDKVSGYFEFIDSVSVALLKIEEIKKETGRRLEELTLQYSSEEVDTWHIQETEAKAYMADITAETPLLEYLSISRGVSILYTVQKVIEKSAIFKKEAGRILGEQKKKLDALGV